MFLKIFQNHAKNGDSVTLIRFSGHHRRGHQASGWDRDTSSRFLARSRAREQTSSPGGSEWDWGLVCVMANCSAGANSYPPRIAELFHSFTHLNFYFDNVSSVFVPTLPDYQQVGNILTDTSYVSWDSPTVIFLAQWRSDGIPKNWYIHILTILLINKSIQYLQFYCSLVQAHS